MQIEPEYDFRSDEDLLSSYKSGNSNALHDLIERWRLPLFRYLYRLIRDRHTAEDLFQETFLAVHRSLHTFEAGRNFKPWLYTIATNLARDEMRRRKKAALTVLEQGGEDKEYGGLKTMLSGDTIAPDEQSRREEQIEFIREALDALPEHQKTTLVLFHYEDMKYREIADMLDIPLGTVKSRLHAALTEIVKMYEKKFGERIVNGI